MRRGGAASRSVAAIALVLLLLPWGSVGAVGGLTGPPGQGACSTTLEQQAAALRIAPYSEDPGAGDWLPWLVARDDIYVPPPPSPFSSQHVDERAEIALLQATRADWQVEAARAWDAGPASRAWDDLVLSMLPAATGADARMNPPRVSRDLAIFEAAMHDALVIAWDVKYCHQRAPPGALDPGLTPVVPQRFVPSYPSEHAVAAGVARVILPEMFPLAPRESFELLARQAAESRVWAGANWRSDVEAGLALGAQVARLALAARAGDGSDATWNGARPQGTCLWEPTDPLVPKPVEPTWGNVRPWLMAAGDQFRPPPPPACDGAEYMRQVEALHEKSLALTPAERAQARYYDVGRGHEYPPGFDVWHARNLTVAAGYTTMQHARVMSHVAAALADAAIAAWDAKYAYWSDRPVHAIHRHFDAAWGPLLRTPDFPGYVSGHATFAGAAEVVLAHYFPSEAAALAQRSQENADSRFLGGVHIEADNEIGLVVGRHVGALAVARDAAAT